MTSELDDFIMWLSEHDGVTDVEFNAIYSLYTDYRVYLKIHGEKEDEN